MLYDVRGGAGVSTVSGMSERTAPVSTIDGQATQALQAALGAEHAALWCYSLAVAFLVEPQQSQARRDADVHRELRSRIEQTLTQIGQRPVSAQPAYATPQPVTDPAVGRAARGRRRDRLPDVLAGAAGADHRPRACARRA